jgi:hypothetical protein
MRWPERLKDKDEKKRAQRLLVVFFAWLNQADRIINIRGKKGYQRNKRAFKWASRERYAQRKNR